MSLKSDILSAYGTCDTIESITGQPLRQALSKELLQFNLLCHPERTKKELEEFAGEYLLLDGLQEEALVQEAIDSLDEQKLIDAGSRIYPEFNWLDSHFQQQNPAFPPLNQKLLRSIYSQIAKDSEKGKAFMHNWQDFESFMQAEEKREEEKVQLEKQSELDEDLKKLHDLIGLYGVKNEIEDLCAMIQIGKLREAKNMKFPPVSRHLVFSGNPGTGKTTVARLLAKLYKDLGILSKGQLVETDRSGLVAGHVGQTALKTQEVIKSALGGVLFIDEAYALVRESPNDFGQEAIAVLLKEMEDHRDDLVVIAAGYPDSMESFLDSNPGLRSRFSKFIYFENYSGKELMEILEKMAHAAQYRLDHEAKVMMQGEFDKIAAHPPVGFANGRYVRNRLENAIGRQARRLWHEKDLNEEQLATLEARDFA